MPVVLWTDALVWLLVVLVIAYVVVVRRREHLAAPWRRVARSGAGMVSAVILVAFTLVGLLDSLHYRPQLPARDAQAAPTYSVEVLSVLDLLLAEVRSRPERTYSAPFATHGYVRETRELADGRIAREFPRLRNGGAHLADPGDRPTDVAWRAGSALVYAAAAWLVLAVLTVAVVARGRAASFGDTWRAVRAGETPTRWRAVLVTTAVIMAIAFPAFSLADQYHVLGTDKVGQDVFYLALKSVRTALVIGALTTLVTLPLGIFAGIAAGYFRGWVDDVIQYVYTTLDSIPSVLLIAAAVLMMQVYIDTHPELFPTTAQRADLRLLFLCVILGLRSWTGLARLLRGETLKLRSLEYVQAAEALGVHPLRILTRHLVPNVMHLVLISMVMEFSSLVLAEAVLSYVGVGVDPTMISFGTMINTARLEMAREPMVWWALAAAFAFMLALVLAANLFADAVRDAFDPRARVGGLAAAGAAR